MGYAIVYNSYSIILGCSPPQPSPWLGEPRLLQAEHEQLELEAVGCWAGQGQDPKPNNQLCLQEGNQAIRRYDIKFIVRAKGAAKYLKYLARVPQTKKGCEPLLYPLARQFHSLSFFKFRNSFHHLNKKRLNESSFLEGFDMLYLVSNRNQSDLGLLFVYYLRHFWKSVNINITCEKRNTTIVKSSKPFLN